MFGSLLALALVGHTVYAAPTDPFFSLSINPRSDPLTTFYLADGDSGLLANAVADPSGIFFGPSWNSPSLFTIDSSTGILLTADPTQTTYDSYIDTGDFSPVQIGTTASSGFIKCSITDEMMSCSADGGYTQFMLEGVSEDATDSQLYFVKPGTERTSARGTSLIVQYASAEPAPLPTEFYLSTAMGYAVDFGANSPIYAGYSYAKDSPGSVYILDNSTGYLKTITSTGDSEASSYVAYIDTSATNDYSIVQLSLLPLASENLSPLSCAISTDGSLVLSCAANGYQQLWLDRESTTTGDYNLYMAKAGSAGKGTDRVDAQVKVSSCTSC